MDKPVQTSFDYIIIGGGSAGSVIANRLSADEHITVCLLEAGPRDNSPFIRMPLGILLALRSNTLNWKFWTEQQKYCANRSIYWPRGRTLGGSSSINAMCYIRGNPHDYDNWAKLGNDEWAYHHLLPYFKKLENYTADKINDYHSMGGPLNVTRHRYINPLMHVFLAAAQQASYKLVDDFNTEQQNDCVGLFDVTQYNGERFSNARAYLHPIESRKNLKIITNAYVTKILFNNKRAHVVCYSVKDELHQIHSRKEIILCAGTIGSPQLLLLSGIGPRAELEKYHIPIVHELPGVGQNLQDHLDIHITSLEKNHYAFSFHFTACFRLIKNVIQYIFYRQGELTINYAQAGGFFRTDQNLTRPNMAWHFVPSVFTNSGLQIRPLFKYYGYTLMISLLHPLSRGSIKLKSANPFQAPMIDPNYLENEKDLNAMVIGFKKSRELLSQSAFRSYFLSELEPGRKIQSDDEIKDYIRQHAETIYHPVGTCKMGNDKMAVVDSELKVHGIEGLRVIDASIMPVIISGNTNTAVTMIAEKGSDLIINV